MDFCGKPIIAYTIEALQESGVVDKIWVSTDDEEIAEIAKSFGAEIPFWRPKDLSDDLTGTIPVIAHAVKVMVEDGLEPFGLLWICNSAFGSIRSNSSSLL